jgi:hypothetical protein
VCYRQLLFKVISFLSSSRQHTQGLPSQGPTLTCHHGYTLFIKATLLNTPILPSSGAAVTWAHHAILAGKEKRAVYALVATVSLALVSTGFQGMEYYQAPSTISDSIYGSTFFLATGFHGFHVIIELYSIPFWEADIIPTISFVVEGAIQPIQAPPVEGAIQPIQAPPVEGAIQPPNIYNITVNHIVNNNLVAPAPGEEANLGRAQRIWNYIRCIFGL